jgi:hypothetical protein
VAKAIAGAAARTKEALDATPADADLAVAFEAVRRALGDRVLGEDDLARSLEKDAHALDSLLAGGVREALDAAAARLQAHRDAALARAERKAPAVPHPRPGAEAIDAALTRDTHEVLLETLEALSVPESEREPEKASDPAAEDDDAAPAGVGDQAPPSSRRAALAYEASAKALLAPGRRLGL